MKRLTPNRELALKDVHEGGVVWTPPVLGPEEGSFYHVRPLVLLAPQTAYRWLMTNGYIKCGPMAGRRDREVVVTKTGNEFLDFLRGLGEVNRGA